MFDCANVEMRELLPELAAGTVDALTRARVEEHVAACAECASELDTLRLVRSAYAGAPAIDVRRVVAALPKPSAARPSAGRAAPVKRWVDWRIAAALTMISVGGLSLAVNQRFFSSVDDRRPDTTVVVTPAHADAVPAVPAAPTVRSRQGDSGRRAVPPTVRLVSPKAQLSFGGGVSDLDEASIQQLLGALEEIDRAPVAPSPEPDHSPVLPVIKGIGQ
jgi:putative zinc finger protein